MTLVHAIHPTRPVRSEPMNGGESGGTDWAEVLAGLVRGERRPAELVARLVLNILRARARGLESEWQDMTQDVLCHVIRACRARKIATPEALPGFVLTVVRRMLWNRGRRGPHGVEIPDPHPELHAIPEPVRAADPVFLHRLDLALKDLTAREREVVECLYLRGISYRETARVLGVLESTVNTLQARAMRKLRRIVQ